MTKAILTVGALLAAAIALAGCGGSVSASGTTGGVAGAHHAQERGSFRAAVHGFEARLRTSVHAFQSGNLSKAIASGGPILNDCMGFVDVRVAPHVSTRAQKQVLARLRTACGEMTEAANAGATGNLTKAKQFAGAALARVRSAARVAG